MDRDRMKWGYELRAYYYESGEHVEIEELYQAFKKRLISELAVDNPDFRVMGLLVDKPLQGDTK